MFKKIAAIAFAVALAPAAFAAAEKGDSEVSVFGNLSYSDAGDSLFAQGTYGYYFTDAVQVAFTFGYVEAGGSDATLFGVNAEYNFSGEDMVPFLFASMVSVDMGGGSSDGYGFGAGAKFYMNENAGFKITAGMNSFDGYDTTDINFGMFYNF